MLPFHGRTVAKAFVMLPGEPISSAEEHVWTIIAWFSQRQFELRLFQKLQYMANNLESLSYQERSNAAAALLTCLIFGRLSRQISFPSTAVVSNIISKIEQI